MSGHLIGILTVFIFGLTFFIYRKLKMSLQTAPLVRSRLLQLEQGYTGIIEALNDDSQFLRFSKSNSLKGELETLKQQTLELKNPFLRREIKELFKKITILLTDFHKLRESSNERFFQKERERSKSLFTDESGKDLLTDEQLRAVICDDNRNLIIAGAGSGKTRVIDFKVRYLVNYKNVSPKKILILSFSRKSASDLAQKISENIPGIEARTIHSFGSQIIGRHDRKLFDEINNELGSIVIQALVQTLKNKECYRLFELFYEKFFSDLKPLIFYKSLDELRKALKKFNSSLIFIPDQFGELKTKRAHKTLKGGYVRSVDERYIADFLFLQDIKYEYESSYPHTDTKYYPDFYLPDYDIYLEHFAITSTGQPPAWFDNPQKYMQGIKWKKKLHREQNTRMIESYSYLLNEEGSSTYLSQLLNCNGIVTRDLTKDEGVLNKISRDISRIFTKFYNSFKLSGLSLKDLKQKYPTPKHLVFLQLFESFLAHLEELVTQENKMDFSDMILGAIDKYQEFGTRSFDYIIVDEFQDTSNLAMRLLNEVYQSNPHTAFLSVGDDWQSIYGFNGSDVTIFSDYARRYSGVAVQFLNSNFRSHAKIVELGKKFISKNPVQIQKDVVSRSKNFENAEIDFLSLDQMDEKIRSIPDHESVFVLYRYNDDCPVAHGMFRDFFVLDKSRKPLRRAGHSKNISMMTIHASKGLEAQHVFLLFPDGVKRKFPSEIEDHFVFNMLKTNSDDFPFSEERRLLYVAITRAEQNLYFFSPSKDPNSVFWDELKELVRSPNKKNPTLSRAS